MNYPERICEYFCFDIIFPKYSAHLSDWSPVLFEPFICFVSSLFFSMFFLWQGHSFMSHQCISVSIVVIQCVNPTVNFCLILSIIIALLIVTTVHTCCNCVFSALLTRLSIVYYMIFDPTLRGNTLLCLCCWLFWKFIFVKLFFSIFTKFFIWLYSFTGSFVDFCSLS